MHSLLRILLKGITLSITWRSCALTCDD